MSKLGCICGHTIVDQTNDIPYKAYFRRDQDFEKFYQFTDDIASFITAIKIGVRNKWIKNFFSEEYPVSIGDSSVVFDIISKSINDAMSDIYQCEKCGRIKIQVRDTNSYASFKPEDNRYPDIFKKFPDDETNTPD